MRLSDKVAIVTGGNRGIGKAISLAFAREGAKVAVVGRNKSRCDEVVDQIREGGGEAMGIQADVASEADVAGVAKQVKDRYGRIDILVNNAAVNLPYRAVTDFTLEEWNWMLGVNLTGPLLCIRSVLPGMIAQRSGKIINLASLGGRHGAAGRVPYRATKAALINMTECVAAEVKEFGIDVNAICPGAVETDMMREITGGEMPSNLMSPDDIATVAIFLASDESKAITGTGIDAFGGSNPLFGAQTSIRPKK
jgi:3-oxoacyl-[acyl-carrier protein] reductase